MSTGTEVLIKNPHSILAALKSRPKEVLELVLPHSSHDGVWDAIEGLARKHSVRVSESFSEHSEGRRDFRRDPRGGPKQNPKQNHKQKQFVGRESSHGAKIRPKTMTPIERMLDGIDQDTRGVWLALDCLQDPQNLGAIFRAASFFGIRGIIMTTERSAPMTSTVYDISAGGVEAVPYVGVANLQRAFEKAKDAGLWILGTSEHAKSPIQDVEKDRPWLVIVGNEEKGMRRLTEEACDVVCTVPNRNGDQGVTSLNVSVATGILLNHLT